MKRILCVLVLLCSLASLAGACQYESSSEAVQPGGAPAVVSGQYADSFDYPVKDDNPEDNLEWGVFQDFGDLYAGMGGYHSGEDWNLLGGSPDADLGKPVYAVANGQVTKVSPLRGDLGYLVAIEHQAVPGTTFIIPQKYGETFSYPTEEVTQIVSVYVHLTVDESQVFEGAWVEKGSPIGAIMNPGGGPHLHFEIRLSSAMPSNDWSMVLSNVGDNSNWAKIGNSYTGYYFDPQKMVDAGLRDPSEFIDANSIPSEQHNLPSISGSILVLSGQGPISQPAIRNYSLWAVNPDTGDKAPLPDRVWNTDKSITISLTHPWTSWSTDGSKIASFWGPQQTYDERRALDTSGVSSIFIIDLRDSTGMRTQLDPPVTEVYYPSLTWSPDGSKIAFHSWWPNSALHVVNINSGQVNHIPLDPQFYDFGWSPDSTKFVISGRTQYSSMGLFIIDSNGGNREDLGVLGSLPTWSPDGSKIAFTTTEDGISTESLCILNLDTHRVEEIPIEGDRSIYNIAWSTDSTEIAFGTCKAVCVGDGSNSILGGIYIINSDGSNLRTLVREDDLLGEIPWLAQVESLPEEIRNSTITQNELVAWIFTK